jgi:TatD DNase family protein
MLIDSHCHLDDNAFASDLPAVLARAREAGVGGFLTAATSLDGFASARAMAAGAANVWCTAGVHPEYAEKAMPAEEALKAQAEDPNAVAVGETGFDYFYDASPRAAQAENFRRHIAVARATGLPLVVHTRDADDDMAEILKDETAKGAFRGVLHSFCSGRALMKTAFGIGFYFSISGMATFKRSEALRELLKEIPLDRLLVETDCPYLAPVPKRGKRNEPAFVVHTAAVLAKIKGVPAAVLAETTTDNFFRLFEKAKRPQ